jgi:hypothetical protein
VEIAASAHKHGVSDEDMRHALSNAIDYHDLGEGFVMGSGRPPPAPSSKWASSPTPTASPASFTPCPLDPNSYEETTTYATRQPSHR